LDAPPPPWREMSEALGRTKLPGAGEGQSARPAPGNGAVPSKSAGPGKEAPSDAASLILRILAESEQTVSYVCIGPLTNLAEALRVAPSARGRISTVFTFGASPEEPKSGWNAERDIEAAKAVFASGTPLYAAHPREEDLLDFDSTLLEEIKRMDSSASRLLSLLHEDERVKNLLLKNHFEVWDETVALYIDNPQVGSFEKSGADLPLFRLSKLEKEAARAGYTGILSRSVTERWCLKLTNRLEQDNKPILQWTICGQQGLLPLPVFGFAICLQDLFVAVSGQANRNCS